MLAKMYKYSAWIGETRADVLFGTYRMLLEQAGFTVVDTMTYIFSPRGFTGIFLLSESHFAIHTFPERNKSYIELTSCVKDYYNRFVELDNVFERVDGD